MWTPPYKRKCWTNSGGPLVISLLWAVRPPIRIEMAFKLLTCYCEAILSFNFSFSFSFLTFRLNALEWLSNYSLYKKMYLIVSEHQDLHNTTFSYLYLFYSFVGFEMLTSNEKRLCSSLRLHPCLYITYKERGGTKKSSHWGEAEHLSRTVFRILIWSRWIRN